MNNPLTPVEVLDSEIEKFRALCATVSRLDRQDTLYLAALELALADAELCEYSRSHNGPPYDNYHPVHQKVRAARTKLYEALQK